MSFEGRRKIDADDEPNDWPARRMSRPSSVKLIWFIELPTVAVVGPKPATSVDLIQYRGRAALSVSIRPAVKQRAALNMRPPTGERPAGRPIYLAVVSSLRASARLVIVCVSVWILQNIRRRVEATPTTPTPTTTATCNFLFSRPKVLRVSGSQTASLAA